MQGLLMSATIEHIKLGGVDVPVVYEEDRNLPTISMQLIFRNSGNIQNGKLYGLSSLSAKLLNEGTKKDGAVKYAAKMEQKAIHLDVSNGNETFVYELSTLKEQFEDGLKLFKQLLNDPNYSKETFAKIVQQTKGVIAQKQNDFDYIATMELKKLLFKDTPLATPSIGDEKSIEKIRLKNIKNFITNNIVLENAIVVIGGDLSKEEALDASKTILKQLSKNSVKPLKTYYASTTPQESVLIKKSEQAYIYFGSHYDASVASKDNYIAKVAHFILGSGGFGSRLMEEIRVKRGLAYSAYSRLNIANSISYFSGYLQTKLESQEEAIKVVKEVVDEFIANGVTQKELDAAKKFIIGSEPLRNETLSQRLNKTFLEFYKGHEFGHSNKELEMIESLDLATLNSYIKKHDEIKLLSFAVVTGEEEK
jgi:predicted Zn-dependent peptidase